MARKSDPKDIWKLVEAQHGVVSREQLLEKGITSEAIDHRLRRGRLHTLHRGIYAVGRPHVSRRGGWIAAVLACGPGATLSFGSAAALWGIERENSRTEVSVPRTRRVRVSGVKVHRPRYFDLGDVRIVERIPVTDPIRTLIDLASRLSEQRLVRAVNEADRRGLVNPEQLSERAASQLQTRGASVLRRLLAGETFALTDSELERRFLILVRRAGLPQPVIGAHLNGFKVDFHWPELGLVVETDGLRYHRTASQQARDRWRDQTHAKAGLTTLRFTHTQVRYRPDEAITTLRVVAERLRLKQFGVT